MEPPASIDPFETEATAAYLCGRGAKRVALQLPDSLLSRAQEIESQLKAACQRHAVDASGAALMRALTSGQPPPPPAAPPKLYLLADTTFGGCCVDEVAAEHAGCDAVVHYGPACLSGVTRLPARVVLGRSPLDAVHAAGCLWQHPALRPAADAGSARRVLLILYDLPYAHMVPSIEAALMAAWPAELASRGGAEGPGEGAGALPPVALVVARVGSVNLEVERDAAGASSTPPAGAAAGSAGHCAAGRCGAGGCGCGALPPGVSEGSSLGPSTLGGLEWTLPPGCTLADCAVGWIGGESPTRTHALLCLRACAVAAYEPAEGEQGGALTAVPSAAPPGHWRPAVAAESRALTRRYYLVERAKDASIVGIVLGTLGVRGYLRVVERLRRLLTAAGKKSYTFVMGRPTPAKLANFLEVDVFVLVACAQTALLDSRDYVRPVITPHEAALALLPGRSWDESKYSLDFRTLLDASEAELTSGPDPDAEPRFSLLTGGYAAAPTGSTGGGGSRGEGSGSGAGGALTAAAPVTALAERAAELRLAAASGKTLAPATAAEYLMTQRTYVGLVPRAGGEGGGAAAGEDGAAPGPAAPAVIVAGQSGRAAGYARREGGEADGGAGDLY